jgi:Rieske Fe-S protein
MTPYPDQAAEAILANRPLPQAKLDDPDEIDAVATAITLRAAGPGADQLDEQFVIRLRRLLATEVADVPAASKLARRTLLVAASVAIAGLTATVAGRTIAAQQRRVSPSGRPRADLMPDNGQWTAVTAESEFTGSVYRFTSPSAVGFIVERGAAILAVSGICTHRGCLLQLDGAAGRLNCPCHRAAFSLDGTLISSDIRPAPDPLPQIATRRRHGQIELLLARPDIAAGAPTTGPTNAPNNASRLQLAQRGQPPRPATR